ncbi:MAG: GHMP kinase [Candidatus Liptonbacteria bacterium]|nr:GHMP kinase [Candidatus Liptonbacteria bacterium]
MIIARVPLRLEFLGGSTDIASFYKRYPGHILNTTIDKYIYVIVKSAPGRGVTLVHEKTERVSDRDKLTHARTRAVLTHFGLRNGVEIISLSDVFGGSGLGSSSAFVVGLVQALAVYTGRRMSKRAIAELAAHIEINVLGEPIGKQDHYAAAFGGLTVTTYQKNGFVDVQPIRLPPKIMEALQNHLLLFYSGEKRSASKILRSQSKQNKENFSYLVQMSDIVEPATKALKRGNLKRFAEYLFEEWTIKKNLSSGVTTRKLEDMYATAVRAGAWGGRVSGAGGGGFIFFFAPPSRHAAIRKALKNYEEFPLRFTEEGSEVLYSS